MDAHITVTGNIGTDIDYRAYDGFSRANFRLASTPRIRRGAEWTDGTTTWVNVECANRIAENARDSLVKGDPVVVTGRLRTRVWEAEGTRHEKLVVEATSIGHDLGRGTTQFTKSAPVERPGADRADAEPEPEPEEDPVEEAG